MKIQEAFLECLNGKKIRAKDWPKHWRVIYQNEFLFVSDNEKEAKSYAFPNCGQEFVKHGEWEFYKEQVKFADVPKDTLFKYNNTTMLKTLLCIKSNMFNAFSEGGIGHYISAETLVTYE